MQQGPQANEETQSGAHSDLPKQFLEGEFSETQASSSQTITSRVEILALKAARRLASAVRESLLGAS